MHRLFAGDHGQGAADDMGSSGSESDDENEDEEGMDLGADQPAGGAQESWYAYIHVCQYVIVVVCALALGVFRD